MIIKVTRKAIQSMNLYLNGNLTTVFRLLLAMPLYQKRAHYKYALS